jgi:uncharacterized protein YebE (UPF0316 family)
MSFLDSNLYIWVVLPILVFFARVSDVTLGTLRIIFISRGKRNLAPLLGFVEVFIWITVVSQIVSHAQNILAYMANEAGFATGAFVGMYIEDRLAIGTQIVRTIIQDNPHELIDNLHSAGYGVTCVDGQGANGPVMLIYTIVMRRNLPHVISIIHHSHPHAFLSVEDLRSIQEGIFPVPFNTQGRLLSSKKIK